MASDDGVIDAAKAAIGDALIDARDVVGEITLVVRREAIVEVCRALRDTPGLEYQQLMEIAGVDYPERAERFEVVYHLLSLTKNRRIRVKVSTDEQTPVPSVTGLWPVAGWLEREVFDMYGVAFSGNEDLRRILTDYGFEGYPQRKDFPLTGHVELRYSEAEKRVVYEPVALPQDFRTFDFLMPWEGPEYRLPGTRRPCRERPALRRPRPPERDHAAKCEDARRDAEDHRQSRRHRRRQAGRQASDKEARKPRAKKAEQEVSKPLEAPSRARTRRREGRGPA